MFPGERISMGPFSFPARSVLAMLGWLACGCAVVAVRADPPLSLPASVVPLYYSIVMQPLLDESVFYGQETIVINILEDTDTIVLHSKNLNITGSVSLYLESTNPGDPIAEAISTVEDQERETLTIQFSVKLYKNVKYIILFEEFVGALNNENVGLFRLSYRTKGEIRWLAATQFRDAGARWAFPCLDEPHLKARFSIAILRDANSSHTAFFNMPFDYSESLGVSEMDGVVDRYVASFPIPTFAVSLVYVDSDFESLATNSSIVRVLARREVLGGGTFAARIAPRALELMEGWAGIPFSLPKLDLLAVPEADSNSANWGLACFRESSLLVDELTSSMALEDAALTVCRAVANQWAGNLVTTDSRSHDWLSDALAIYLGSSICDEIEPSWNLPDKFIPRVVQVAMGMESENSVQSDGISLWKGASLLRMFHHALTPPVFKAGVQRYLVLNSLKSAGPDQLHRAFGFAAQRVGAGPRVLPANTSWQDIASSWTTQPGLPVLHVVRDYQRGTACFRQERLHPVRGEGRWWIPVSWAEGGARAAVSTTPRFWLAPNQDNLTTNVAAKASAWLLVNPSQTGYYRVNYDHENWVLLSRALSRTQAADSALGPATRAQLLGDALSLARAGHLDYGTALTLTKALAEETEVAPWMTALSPLQDLYRQFYATPAAPYLRMHLRRLVERRFALLGLLPKDSDSHDGRVLRLLLAPWACLTGVEDCLRGASALFKQWLADNELARPAGSGLHPDILDTTLCYGVREGDSEAFAKMKTTWLAQKNADLRYKCLSALACSKNHSLLEGIVRDGISNALLPGDSLEVRNIFQAISDREENHNLIMDFVRGNLDDIDKYFQDNGTQSFMILRSLIAKIQSRDELEEVRKWMEDNFTGHIGYGVIQKSLATAETNVGWIHDKYKLVAKWLAEEALGSLSTQAPYPTTTTTHQEQVQDSSSGSHPESYIAVLVATFLLRAHLNQA